MKNIYLLDMDETLLDFSRLEREDVKRVLKEYGCERIEEGAKRFHEINAALWLRLERGEIKRQEILTKRFELLFEEFGIVGDVKSAAYDYFDYLGKHCYPYDGAVEFLKELSRTGRVYIVTNGATDVQRRHIADAGFAPYLTDVFISDDVGHSKPSAEHANYVAAHIPAFVRENAVYMGDSLTSDMLCAERMGVDFVLYQKVAPPDYAGRIAKNYGEALDLFRSL